MKPSEYYLFVCLLICGYVVGQEDTEHPCSSQIYCYGDLLHTVQMARLEKDSKSFVDMALKFPSATVLQNFNNFYDPDNPPSQAEVAKFVSDNFVNGTEFGDYSPEDWIENPAFLQEISDSGLRQFGSDLNKIWKELGRKIKDDVNITSDQYSMYYVPNPVIVPGGRFKEFYYWDSYWIQKGLLVSEMRTTVKGMIENFIEIVKLLGFIPNGGRIYYQRTQPPFLIPMVKNYYDATNDSEFVKTNIAMMITEFNYFMENRLHEVTINGATYKMARYRVDKQGPRPESYREDFELAEWLRKTLNGIGASPELIASSERDLYINLKSGAESGWDFSSRWFVPMPNNYETGDLMNTRTSDIFPADLNGLLYWNARLLEGFCNEINDPEVCDATHFGGIANDFKAAINQVLWDEESGSWFDYDYVRGELRKAFYPTNLVPLWVHAHEGPDVVPKVVKYLRDSGALAYPAGIPTSLFQTGQQWDFPNGWAPLQHIVVEALENSDNTEAQTIAFDIAQKWVKSNHITFQTEKAMFEKYDVTVVGSQGGGGEYDVVLGFGWSNGVILDFLKKYGNRLKSEPINSGGGTLTTMTLMITILPLFSHLL